MLSMIKINNLLINQINVKILFFFSIGWFDYFKGPVVKQTTIAEKPPEQPSLEPVESIPEKPSESPTTNEQSLTPTEFTNESDKKDDEPVPPKDLHIELKPITACKTFLYSLKNSIFYFI